MLRKRIRERCNKKGITSGYQLMHALGIKSPTVAQALYNETFTRMSDETLTKLCIALECQPGDLFEFVPEQKGK